jgi:hypothetical protein
MLGVDPVGFTVMVILFVAACAAHLADGWANVAARRRRPSFTLRAAVRRPQALPIENEAAPAPALESPASPSSDGAVQHG